MNIIVGEIRVKRGLKANLPVLNPGEPAYCTDTKEYYIGTPDGNVLVGSQTSGGDTGGGGSVPSNVILFEDWTEGETVVIDTSTTPSDTTAPVLTVTAGGTFTGTKTVTLSVNETADIFYTLDGSTPTTASTKYTAPLSISATTTLKAFARDTAGNVSAVQTVTYTLEVTTEQPPADTTAPVLTMTSAQTFTDSLTVNMSTNEAATIWYTIDDSDPITSGTRLQYTAPITITETDTFKAYAVDSANNASAVQTVTYTKQTAPVTNFDGTQNAFVQNSYLYVNPETILDTDFTLRTGESSHIYFSFSPFLQKIDKNLALATASNASNAFNGVIPFAGEHSYTDFTNGLIDCPDTAYIVYQSTIYVRIPATLYANNSNSLKKSLFSISARLPVQYAVTNEEIVINDSIIDSIASMSAVTVTNSLHSGFLNLPSALNGYTSITDGVNSISGRYISTVTDREMWYVNATTRLNFKIPQSQLATADLASIKQYLKDNRLTIWIAK